MLKNILHHYGLKATEARLKILKILLDSPVALSHSDIISRIRDYNIDKVTLYRILNVFTDKGLTHKVANQERNWLYALYFHGNNQAAGSDDHAHFICDECEKIYCLPMETTDHKPAVKNDHRFLITSHEYRIHGVCPDCN